MKSLPHTKRKRTFRRMRRRMSDLGLRLIDIELATGLSKSSVGERMAGRQSWRIEEAYCVLDLLNEPVSTLPEYFPINIFEEVI